MGIGVDIIEIKRIRKACGRKQFRTRIFTQRELGEIDAKKNKYAHMAGKFAAKEAVAKSLGTGFSGIKWKDIEILNHKSGKPFVRLHGRALEVLKSKGLDAVNISISHCREYAVAFSIVHSGGGSDEGSISFYNEIDG